MSDIPPLPDYLRDADDEELVFEDAVTVAIAAEAVPAPRRGRSRKAASPATPEADMVAEPAPPPAPVLAPAPEPDVAPAASVAAAPAGSKIPMLLIAITLFALLTSLVSLGGMIAVGRALARVEAQGQHSAAERRAFAEAPALIARLTQVGQRLDTASQRYAAAAPSGPPASIADIRHELDMLRFGLSQHQPDAVSSLGGITREGFTDLATRIGRLQAQLAPRPAPDHHP